MGLERIFFLLCLAVAMAIIGASASARGPDPSSERVEGARFQLKATNGFKAEVDAGAGRVQLTLTRTLKHRRDVAVYVADGEVSTQAVKADFGTLGSIDLSFHPTGVAEGLAPPAGCDGYYVKGESGAFTGTVRFQGEEGFAQIAAIRATGEVAASTRWDCHRTKKPVSPRPLSALRVSPQEREEEAQARGYGHLIAYLPGRRFFRAVGGPTSNGHFGPAFFVAATFERSESVEIAREVAVEDFQRDFRFDEGLRSAAVRPGGPFTGGARFARDAGGHTNWTGSLAVALPGSKDVPLVGPGFKSQLSHDLPGD